MLNRMTNLMVLEHYLVKVYTAQGESDSVESSGWTRVSKKT